MTAGVCAKSFAYFCLCPTAGFISFTVMMLLESHVLSHDSHWVVGFEFAHIAIFFIVRASTSPSSIPNFLHPSPAVGLDLHRASNGTDADHDEGEAVGLPDPDEGR